MGYLVVHALHNDDYTTSHAFLRNMNPDKFKVGFDVSKIRGTKFYDVIVWDDDLGCERTFLMTESEMKIMEE